MGWVRSLEGGGWRCNRYRKECYIKDRGNQIYDSLLFFQLLHFLMHLCGGSIGLSVYGLVVIDKNFALSVSQEKNYIYFNV